MDSWRKTASPQAQEELDGLLDAALGFAQQQLASHGEFFPFAAAIGADGAPEMIAARPNPRDEHPRSAEVIEACVAALASQRERIRASAVVADVRLPELGTDAIRVDLEHAEGPAITVLLSYAKKRRRPGIEYGQLRAQVGHRRIWT